MKISFKFWYMCLVLGTQDTFFVFNLYLPLNIIPSVNQFGEGFCVNWFGITLGWYK